MFEGVPKKYWDVYQLAETASALYGSVFGPSFKNARDLLRTLCPNIFTFQTQLSKLKRWLEKRALPEEVCNCFKLTDEEFKEYQEHAAQVKQRKAEKLGLVTLDEADHDAWDLSGSSVDDIKEFLETISTPQWARFPYVRFLILGGRRGQDLFQARYSPSERGPTWCSIANAAKARQLAHSSYEFPLLCSETDFHRILEYAREVVEPYKNAAKYQPVAQLEVDLFLDAMPVMNVWKAGRPVTPHRLRKLYATLLLKCYDTHPLGADEFLRRAFNHRNAATKVYFPPSEKLVQIGGGDAPVGEVGL